MKGRAVGTRVKYRHSLQAFAAWAGERPAAAIKPQDVELFLSAWRQNFGAAHGRPPAIATVKAQITALRAFYSYLERNDWKRLAGNRRGPQKNPMALAPGRG